MPTMHVQRCVLLALLGIANLSVLAETPTLRQLGPAQGLPSGRVLDLVEDAQQRLWIATLDGLARFDGHQLEVFRYHSERSDSLPGNVTQVLMIDRQDRLWVGLEGQGVVRHLGGDRFQRPPLDSELARSMDAWALAEDGGGRVWVGGYRSGVLLLDESMREVERIRAGQQGLLSDTTLWLMKDQDDAIWLASERGLQRWDGRMFTTAAFTGVSGDLAVLRLTPSPNGLVAVTNGGVFIGDANMKFDRYPQSAGGKFTVALSDGDDDALWVGMQRGLLRLAADETLNWGRYSGSELGRQSIADLHRDREGGLWIATDGAGVFRLPPRWRRFRSWLASGQDLQTERVHSATFAPGGALYTGGLDGVIERIDLADGAVRRISPASEAGPLAINRMVLNGDQLWLAHSRGFDRIEVHTGQRLALPPGAEDAAAEALIDLLVDADDTVWLLGQFGLQQRNRQGLLQAQWTLQSLGWASSPRQLRLSPTGEFWLAGEGLARLGADRAELQRVDEFGRQAVDAFAFDGSDRLWLSRRDELQRYRRDSQQWALEARYRLPGSVEAGDVWVDPEHHVWLSTARGLLHFDSLRGRFQRYGLEDGLADQVFRPASIAVDAGRRFLAISESGVVLVEPQEFEQPLELPPLQTLPLRWQRQGRFQQAIVGEPLQLQFDDRELHFALRPLSFANPERWRFRHRLSPFDADWVEVDGARERIISRLPAGHYRWEAEVAGPWTGWRAATPVEFRVLPPWWAQPWARLLQAMLVLALILLFARLVKRRAQRRAELALAESERRWAIQASEQKTRFLQSLAHELRTPMTGVLGMAELLAESKLDPRQREQLDGLRRAGEVLLRQLNETLDLARIEAGSLELREQPYHLSQVVEQSIALMRPLAARKGLRLDSEWDDALPTQLLGDADRLQQVLLNLISNAIKYTEQGGIRVLLNAVGHAVGPRLQLAVVDSGCGLSPEQQSALFGRFAQAPDDPQAQRPGGSGLGLQISRELVRAMGGELVLSSELGVGTRVSVQLPLRVANTVAAEPVAIESGLPATPVDVTGLRVLLLEDDADAAAAIVGLLQLVGCQVEHCANPLQALSTAACSSFDLILLDLDLPGMDGQQVASLLRTQGMRMPIWAVSARLAPGLEEQVRAVGMQGLLSKPIERSRLNTVLSSVRPSLPTA